MFVTLVLAHYRWHDGRLRLACAGHPPPLLRHAGGRIEALETRSGLVGAFGEAGYENTEIRLAAGDTLVLYTDGATEAGASGGDLYGLERLEARISESPAGTLEQLCESVLADVLAHCGQAPEDDITMLVLRRQLVATPAAQT